MIGSYLGQTKPGFCKRVYPEEYTQRIQTSLNWYSGVLRPLSQMIVKIIMTRHLASDGNYSPQEIDDVKRQFYEECLVEVDRMLAKRQYLCTVTSPSFADLVFYSEITTVMYLERYQLRKSNFPSLYQWLKRLGDIKEIKESDEKLLHLLSKEGLD